MKMYIAAILGDERKVDDKTKERLQWMRCRCCDSCKFPHQFGKQPTTPNWSPTCNHPCPAPAPLYSAPADSTSPTEMASWPPKLLASQRPGNPATDGSFTHSFDSKAP